MRFPHIIDTNTKLAYETSQVSATLVEENSRLIKPEDLTWDEEFLPTLAYLSLVVIANNFSNNPLLDVLVPIDRFHLLELISTDIALPIVVPLIEEEYYWKRRYEDAFGNLHCKKHEGWTWKCVYLERYVQKKLENAQPEYKDELTFKKLLDLCFGYIHILSIEEQQHWCPPKTLLKKQWPHIFPVTHISLVPIFTQLEFIQELEITYGMNNVEDKFEFHMFKIDPIDLVNLGEAVMLLPLLRILRLHNSDIKYLHIKALIQKIIRISTLIELDLSYCKIGNLGTKCVGGFIQAQENLRIVNLKDNDITEDGALGLAWVLISPEGTYLRHLNLALNPLGHAGCMAILRALVRGPTPRELSMAACQISGITAVRLGAALKINSSLRCLDISNNNLAEGTNDILIALRRNRRLIELEFRNTNLPDEVVKELKEILKKNKELHSESRSVLDFGYLQNIEDIRAENDAAVVN